MTTATTTKHTPEPWQPESDLRLIDADGCIVADFAQVVVRGRYCGPDNLLRAVACVNACAGIEDPAATLAEARAAMQEIILHSEFDKKTWDAVKAVLAKLGKG